MDSYAPRVLTVKVDLNTKILIKIISNVEIMTQCEDKWHHFTVTFKTRKR